MFSYVSIIEMFMLIKQLYGFVLFYFNLAIMLIVIIKSFIIIVRV